MRPGRNVAGAGGQNRPKGLAAFLGKVTGVSLAIKKLHEHRDRERVNTYRADRSAIIQQQADELALFDKRQELQTAELKRRQRALAQIEKKELASVQQAARREQRQKRQQQHIHSPTFALTLGPPGRPAAIDKAASRYTSETRCVLEADENKLPRTEKKRRINLMDEFTRVAGRADDDDGGGGGGDTGGHTPKSPNKPCGPDRPHSPDGRPRRTRKNHRDRDHGRGM